MDFDKLTVTQLRDKLTKRGIQTTTRTTKAELIEKLSQSQAISPPSKVLSSKKSRAVSPSPRPTPRPRRAVEAAATVPVPSPTSTNKPVVKSKKTTTTRRSSRKSPNPLLRLLRTILFLALVSFSAIHALRVASQRSLLPSPVAKHPVVIKAIGYADQSIRLAKKSSDAAFVSTAQVQKTVLHYTKVAEKQLQAIWSQLQREVEAFVPQQAAPKKAAATPKEATPVGGGGGQAAAGAGGRAGGAGGAGGAGSGMPRKTPGGGGGGGGGAPRTTQRQPGGGAAAPGNQA